jgi:hypothetical protein
MPFAIGAAGEIAMPHHRSGIVWIPVVIVLGIASASMVSARVAAVLIDPAVLQPLLPAAPEGWTLSRARHDRIDTPDCTFSFAEAMFTKGEMNVRLTVADTAGAPEALMVLATMVMTLPPDFVGDVPPSTIVRRSVIEGQQAAERFSAADRDGEVIILVDKRFVVKAEGRKLSGLDALQTMVRLIDLKKVAALK